MNKLEYSPLVMIKLKILKEQLIDKYDEETANKVVSGIISDAEILKQFKKSGTNIAEMYVIDTQYWYFFTHRHYLVYRFEPGIVVISGFVGRAMQKKSILK